MNQADELKARFLKKMEVWPTEVVTSRGIELTIQALNRDQVLRAGEMTAAERECFMVSEAVIEPFTLTMEEVQGLRVGSLPLDLEQLTVDISKLSGLDKKGKEAQNEAFKSVRDES